MSIPRFLYKMVSPHRPRLTSEELSACLVAVSRAMATQLSAVTADEKVHGTLVDFFKAIKMYEPHSLFRPDHVDLVNAQVLGNEVCRSALFRIQYEVYLTAGRRDDFVVALCNTLEDALMIDGPCVEFNMLPAIIKESMPLAFLSGSAIPATFFGKVRKAFTFNPLTSISEFLRSNPLLVILLLIRLIEQTDSDAY
jgi:hypothetical protein